MVRAKTVVCVFLFALALAVPTPLTARGGAAATNAKRTVGGAPAAQNRFVGRWTSRVGSSGAQVADGVIVISEANPPSADRVVVTHSLYGGSITGYTLPYPDRIEFQIPLGDGRVVHYNGVLVSATRIEGYRFVTEGGQSQGGGLRAAQQGTGARQAAARTTARVTKQGWSAASED